MYRKGELLIRGGIRKPMYVCAVAGRTADGGAGGRRRAAKEIIRAGRNSSALSTRHIEGWGHKIEMVGTTSDH